MTNKKAIMLYFIASSSLCAWVCLSSMYDSSTRFIAWFVVGLYLKIILTLNVYEFSNKSKSLNKQASYEAWCIRESQDNVDWGRISRYQCAADWDRISEHYKLSEDCIREFQDKVDWKKISSRENLSNDFKYEFKDKLKL